MSVDLAKLHMLLQAAEEVSPQNHPQLDHVRWWVNKELLAMNADAGKEHADANAKAAQAAANEEARRLTEAKAADDAEKAKPQPAGAPANGP